ncbi:unnamed protein product [Angiostrongylus costaricensis]|uniref:Fibronectin type-III domain-containing protein n=1 Tax=Angiostrongylus costaricensis TaxID=334426 RepID=A0A0R3PIM2_ANGCS|nr:unnamed protein product [Angiostrongylus costaricensis]
MAKTALPSSIHTTFKLPDSKVISVRAERFSHYCSGWKQWSPRDLVQLGYEANTILKEGNTLFSGLAELTDKEMTALVPRSIKIRIVASPERKYSVWVGVSVLASLSSFQEMWITGNEYNECRPSIVHRKCC